MHDADMGLSLIEECDVRALARFERTNLVGKT
jgi:hypothetical protein